MQLPIRQYINSAIFKAVCLFFDCVKFRGLFTVDYSFCSHKSVFKNLFINVLETLKQL